MIKARVHLIAALPEGDPFSFRTDVLALTRDPQWVFEEALGVLIRALLAVKQPAHRVKVLNQSLEWVPTLREATQRERGPEAHTSGPLVADSTESAGDEP